MKKLLFLQTKLIIDGPGIVVRNIIKYLDRSVYCPVVGCMYEGGDLSAWYKAQGIQTVNFAMKGPLHGWLDMRVINRIVEFLKTEQIDLVHTHLVRADIFGRIASGICRIPVLTTIHNTEIHHTSGKVFDSGVRYLDRKTFRICKKIVVVSGYLKKFISDIYDIHDTDITVVYNGIDMPENGDVFDKKAWGIPDDSILICTVARLHPQKGIPFVIKAINTVVKKGLKATAVVVGDGPLRNEIEALIRAVNAPVVLAGFQKDVFPFIRAADIFILPSLWEGFGLSIIEAMSFSKPVIASSVGGISEIVEDGGSGILCPPGDHEKLADAMVMLIQNPDLRKTMGDAGKKRVEQLFTAERMSRRYQKIYRELIPS